MEIYGHFPFLRLFRRSDGALSSMSVAAKHIVLNAIQGESKLLSGMIAGIVLLRCSPQPDESGRRSPPLDSIPHLCEAGKQNPLL